MAAGVSLERIELPLPLGNALPCLLLLHTLGLDALGIVDGEAAEFVGFGTGQGSSRLGVASGTLWVDIAHSELIAACLLGSKFTGQQREPFLLVSSQRRSPAGARCFNGTGGVGRDAFPIHVECMDDAQRLRVGNTIRYALVVSAETAGQTSNTIHDEVRDRLRLRARERARDRIRP